MNKIYAGIGSRQTPPEMLEKMTAIAYYLDRRGYVLRSGGASGADSAFDKGSTKKEIYLPWRGFNGSDSGLYDIPEEAYKIASQILPEYSSCTDAIKRLKSRNMLQILGQDLNTPVEFVICWTQDGKLRGGTAAAIRLAYLREIRVFNLALNKDLEYIRHTIQNGADL